MLVTPLHGAIKAHFRIDFLLLFQIGFTTIKIRRQIVECNGIRIILNHDLVRISIRKQHVAQILATRDHHVQLGFEIVARGQEDKLDIAAVGFLDLVGKIVVIIVRDQGIQLQGNGDRGFFCLRHARNHSQRKNDDDHKGEDSLHAKIPPINISTGRIRRESQPFREPIMPLDEILLQNGYRHKIDAPTVTINE